MKETRGGTTCPCRGRNRRRRSRPRTPSSHQSHARSDTLPAIKKISSMRVNGNMIFKGHKLTIGLDLGDRWSFYCILDEGGKVLLEQKVATTPEAMKQIFEKIPRSLMAMIDRNTFSLGKPAAKGAGASGTRGP